MSRLKHDEGFGEPSVINTVINICDSDSWSASDPAEFRYVMGQTVSRSRPRRGGPAADTTDSSQVSTERSLERRSGGYAIVALRAERLVRRVIAII